MQGYDRYAYVANNPLLYVDPSGHTLCNLSQADDGPAQYAACYGTGSGGSDPVSLTHAGDQATTEYGETFTRERGGADISSLFIDYQTHDGWWNNNRTTQFGIEEFIGMYLLFESNSDLTIADVLATITAQNLYLGGFNPPTCNVGGQCFNAVFNFIAANIDGGSGLLAGSQNPSVKLYDKNAPSDLGGAAGIRNTMSTLGQNALSPSSVITWDRNSGPSSWGNNRSWAKALITDQIWEGFHGLS